jgi:8-oxo-dGTP pyrophosphatase MutT (NUDIX family)
MQVVRAQQPFPDAWSRAIFLAGPTPRASNPVPSWRPDALQILERLGYDGVVFVPEPADGHLGSDYPAQLAWETEALHLADVIVFWVPRELSAMPAFTTNVEFGRWIDSQKCVLGHPPDAPKTGYLDALLAEVTNGVLPHSTLEETLADAVRREGEGAHRQDGERYVPLYLWRTPLFQAWHGDLVRAGNRLDEARIRWAFVLPGRDLLLAAVLWVKVWVEAEGRHKANEWIFARSDLSSVVLYRRPEPPLDPLLDTELVLIREFRSPGRTADGFVHELPGGSSAKASADPRQVAADEVAEETSLAVAPDRLVPLGSRQAAATVSTHQVHVFAVELSAAEMETARTLATEGQVHGNEAETERTVVEVTTLREMLAARLVDWSTLGMVTQALLSS